MSKSDRNGRRWAKLSKLKEGDLVELDGGFTCRAAGKARLYQDEKGLYFQCREGGHHIAGQATDGETLVGIYPIRSSPA